MLVVSRRQNQTLVFPHLNILVEVLRTAGTTVSVGVKAPDQVRILWVESGDEVPSHPDATETEPPVKTDAHAMRNELNRACLALHLVFKQLEAGRSIEAEDTVAEALASLAKLDRMAAATAVPTVGRSDAVDERRALLIEDGASERGLLAGYLRWSGYQVDTVEDGAAAIEYLERSRPDAVVMDMYTPRMKGLQTVKEIRRRGEWDDIPLFIICGLPESEFTIKDRDRDIGYWFEKPLKPDDVVEHLSTAFHEGIAC